MVHQKLGRVDHALLMPAERADMLSQSLKFNWNDIWMTTFFGWEGIVKCVYKGSVKGLMQYAIQPEAEPEDDNFVPIKQPGFVEVVYLEAVQDIEQRLIDPVGYWLMWYAVQTALQYCEGSKNNSVLGLLSKPESCSYYKNKVKMDYGSFTTNTPSGTTATPFRFTDKAAQSFCNGLQTSYGRPTKY